MWRQYLPCPTAEERGENGGRHCLEQFGARGLLARGLVAAQQPASEG